MERMTLLEIDKQIEETCNKLVDLRDQRSKILCCEHDWKGKYIYHKDYGYMYVVEQIPPRDGENTIALQGIKFQSNPGVYSDNCFFTFNALGEWEIPIQKYQKYIEKRMFKELTKEKFYAEFKKSLKKMSIASEKVFKKLTNK